MLRSSKLVILILLWATNAVFAQGIGNTPGSSGGGATGANPTAIAGPVAINGTATTFMRSDASPAVQLGTSGQTGLLQGDGATLGISSGVISLNLANANIWTGNQTVSSASFGLSGAISAPAWTTTGVRYKNVAATLTDTTSNGTVATAYTDAWGGNTIAATNAGVTFTSYYGSYFANPIAGTNVTLTNKYALGADSINATTISQGGVTLSSTYCALTGCTYTGAVTFPNSDIKLVGSSTGSTTFTSANAGASNFTLTFPAATDTLAVLGTAQTFTANQLFPAGSATNPGVAVGVVGTGLYSVSTTGTGLANNGTKFFDFGITNSGISLSTTTTISSGNLIFGASAGSVLPGGTGLINWNGRGILSSSAAGDVQCGNGDAAAPVSCLFSMQSVVAGTSNTAGANATIQGSLSTGSGASGDIIFKTGGTGASATVQNTATTALTIKGATQETIFAAPYRAKGYIVSGLPAGNQGDMAFVTDAVACTFLATLTGGSSTVCPVFYNGTAWVGG